MIEVRDVTKRYEPAPVPPAVEGVSFSVGAGEVVGFLGPNGAGKSTLLRMISTWLAPTAGTITVAGHDTVAAPLAVRRSLGYLPEHNALWDTMVVARFLDFVGRLHGLSGERLAARRAWVVEACELAPVLSKRIAHCSKGFRQRIGVAAALVHDPPVIVLDEPTHGLDPLQVVAFREFIRALAHDPRTSAGGTPRAVLFSSHVLAEVAAISDRVLVIHHGRLLLEGRTADLVAQAEAAGTDLEGLVLARIRAEGTPGARTPEAAR